MLQLESLESYFEITNRVFNSICLDHLCVSDFITMVQILQLLTKYNAIYKNADTAQHLLFSDTLCRWITEWYCNDDEHLLFGKMPKKGVSLQTKFGIFFQK